MYPAVLGIWALGLVNFLGLGILSFVVWKKILVKQKKQVGDLTEEFKDSCVQRVSLKRYNPYHDTGGDQSFTIALLDGKGDGVVITSLHSRAGTRVFAKEVKRGLEGEHKLSEEEADVVKEALK